MKNEIRNIKENIDDPKSKPIIIDSLRFAYWIPMILGAIWCIGKIIEILFLNDSKNGNVSISKIDLILILSIILINSFMILKLSLFKK
jgi:hypothetical protein